MLLDYHNPQPQLIDQLPQTYFFTEAFARYVESNQCQRYVIFFSEVYSAFIPLVVQSNKFLKIARYADRPQQTGRLLTAEETAGFHAELLSYLRKGKVADRITFYLPFITHDAAPVASINCNAGHYEVDLTSADKDNLLTTCFKSKTRNMIRRGQKSGVTVEHGKKCFDHFYALYEDTCRRSDAYIDSYEELMSLYSQSQPYCEVFVAYHDGQPQSGAVIAYCGHGAYYLFAGSATPIVQGSTNLLQYEIMQFLILNNIDTYYLGGVRLKNVEGTKYKGIQKFKESIGGEVHPGYLWKADIATLKCKLYDSLLNLKLRLAGQTLQKDFIDSQK